MKSLLRVTTAGHVDDGKSTLIGRLFLDNGKIHKDILASVSGTSGNLAHFTDGLKQERELGITIDVGYRYFESHSKKYIVADAPGHEEYTRNYAATLTQADCVLILIDATRGLSEQTYRHLHLAKFLQTPSIVYVINKMDLVNYSQEVFKKISNDINPKNDQVVIPVSALDGDNIVHRSNHLDWYRGPTLMGWLDQLNLPSPGVTELSIEVQAVTESDIALARLRGGEIHIGQEVMNQFGEVALIDELWSAGEKVNVLTGPLPIAFKTKRSLCRGELLFAQLSSAVKSRDWELQWSYLGLERISSHEEFILKLNAFEITFTPTQVAEELLLSSGRWAKTSQSDLIPNTIYKHQICTERALYLGKGQRHKVSVLHPKTFETIGLGFLVQL